MNTVSLPACKLLEIKCTNKVTESSWIFQELLSLAKKKKVKHSDDAESPDESAPKTKNAAYSDSDTSSGSDDDWDAKGKSASKKKKKTKTAPKRTVSKSSSDESSDEEQDKSNNKSSEPEEGKFINTEVNSFLSPLIFIL